jgi:membrane-bound lytic murein transglycosylase A
MNGPGPHTTEVVSTPARGAGYPRCMGWNRCRRAARRAVPLRGVAWRALVCVRAPCLAVVAVALALGAAPPVRAAQEIGPLRTRHAEFVPQSWQALPGWTDESHVEALAVFRASCAGLQRRAAWLEPCEQARSVGPGGTADEARAFFERAFVPYRIDPVAERAPRLLTGYFEPVLDGALRRDGRFTVPVLGVPDDLLHIDARKLPPGSPAEPLLGYLDGREVVPLAAADRVPTGRSTLQIDPEALRDETLDRRFRVRLEGDRVRRYWSRADIEAGRGRPVPLAWVEDADALYVMQVQGSGRLRLPDGGTLHLAYADQNGHPFRPSPSPATGYRSRSIDTARADDASGPPLAMRERAATDPQVQRVIDTLLSGPRQDPNSPPARSRERDAALPTGDRRSASGLPPPAPGPAPGARTGEMPAPIRMPDARRSDPSFVYFRTVRGDTPGPMGALGVTLTPTRSIAVDPRVTPLGAPVFIDSRPAPTAGPMRRLVFAHDTGGAIRGAVRGDFFWGTGPDAGLRALRTRDPLSMWVLLPRGVSSVLAAGVRTRSIPSDAVSECTLPDDDYC